MIEFIYIPIILFLYYRTWNYYILIDDHVARDGYMYVITTKKQDPAIYEVRRNLMATVTNVGVFIATCCYIHYFWGWRAALLFAVFPLNVSGVAWITGNYYMSTVLLVLACRLFLTHFGAVGTGLALLTYTAALNSTLSSIPYVVMALLHPLGYTFIWPFLCFMFGNRMRTGLSKRKVENANYTKEAGKFHIRNLLRCPRVIAYYIVLSLFPNKLAFFHSYGTHKSFLSIRRLVISCILCLCFWKWALLIDWEMALWWLAFMGLFSQFVIFGQFTTERYTYLPNVAFCVLMAKFLTNPVVFAIVATLYFCRSLEYIPAWKTNERLFSYSVTQQPEAPENYGNLASYYLDKGQPQDAIRPLLVAESLATGRKYNVWINLACCYLKVGRYEEGKMWTERALTEAPDDKRNGVLQQLSDINNKMNTMQKNKKLLRKEGII